MMIKQFIGWVIVSGIITLIAMYLLATAGPIIFFEALLIISLVLIVLGIYVFGILLIMKEI